ncbi:MAG: 2-oxoglutarate dehydrogenase E1 component [Candidatus Rhabdochlamydia sp.]|jgi:2-oxoglutarate dehydrogenase E1 component|nr:2-oxoglutarate dehydrogenase component [Chlamydiota bacterium]
MNKLINYFDFLGSYMAFSSLSIPNLCFIDNLYQKFIEDPSQMEPSWRAFFQGMHVGLSQSTIGLYQEQRIKHLIDSYRKYGYLLAFFNPLKSPSDTIYELDLKTLGFTTSELNEPFPTCDLLKKKQAPLKEILDLLKKIYCSKIGIEYMNLRNHELETWIQNRFESSFKLDKQQKLLILEDLNKAELFESFLNTKYVGQKRFSLEGAETLIPMLSFLMELTSLSNIDEVVLGMTHRGRLNVLANIIHKDYSSIFREFDENYINQEFEGSGDVKYHQGAQGTFTTSLGKNILVTLAANPSHLESVDPVVEGISYAKSIISKKDVISVLIHGDASFSGQGVVYETMQLCKLNGYQTRGTIHFIINNQIGFTTNPEEARSTLYCSDLAKIFNCPVFHVNAEDPEGCIQATILSMEIRLKFGCDVFIDLNCYRKYGHNENDEPLFSQPLLYTKIKERKSIRTIFAQSLLQENIIQEKDIKSLEEGFKKQLQEAFQKTSPPITKKKLQVPISLSDMDTRVPLKVLGEIGKGLYVYPKNLNLNPKIKRLLQERKQMLQSDPKLSSLNWGGAEQLAYASLLAQKIALRFSGQDACRGTFSHRHAVLIDQLNEKRYFPLDHITESQAKCTFLNSPLSEYAVLGFEFGFSLASKALVIWEAQFGDFANGAQIILDQYLASSEQKWGIISNLVLMLPHGYEGQGPEHSSARIERFLQLAAQDNLRVANCSTPAQIFHLLRAQALCPIKKPLVLFTPKALLRNDECRSSLNDLIEERFYEVLEDPWLEKDAKLLLFCSGKIYYDLVQVKKKQNRKCAIIRLEQLYPFPKNIIQKILAKHPNASCRFVQEEPRNMGAWESLRFEFDELLGTKSSIEYIGRQRSASPAVGSYAVHKQELEELLKKAFA